MSKKTQFVVVGLLVLALFVLSVGGRIALAQGPTPTPPAPPKAKGLAPDVRTHL